MQYDSISLKEAKKIQQAHPGFTILNGVKYKTFYSIHRNKLYLNTAHAGRTVGDFIVRVRPEIGDNLERK